MTDTEPKATAPSLREQLVAAIDDYPVACWTPGNLADRVLAVILPHGKFLGDQLRDSEARLAETRATLDEVLRHFTHKGHPGEPCLQTGWISEKTVARWRAVLYPPQPTGHDDRPSVREAAANDRAHWADKYAEEGP